MLVLASASPRRRELIGLLGLPFEIVPSAFDERSVPAAPAGELVRMLALGKAADVASQRPPGDIVLGADTVVAVSGRILGKPRDEADARTMLGLLSGAWHEVYTGIALLRGDTRVCETVVTRVRFLPLPPALIEWYVGTGEPSDKAGAYGIQGRGALLAERIEGDWSNVVGLPLPLVARILRDSFGVGPGAP